MGETNMTSTFKSFVLAACTVAALGGALTTGSAFVVDSQVQARGNGGGGGGGDAGAGGSSGLASPNYDIVEAQRGRPNRNPPQSPPRSWVERGCYEAIGLSYDPTIRCTIRR
jgi:hypothetical protein